MQLKPGGNQTGTNFFVRFSILMQCLLLWEYCREFCFGQNTAVFVVAEVSKHRLARADELDKMAEIPGQRDWEVFVAGTAEVVMQLQCARVAPSPRRQLPSLLGQEKSKVFWL